MVNHPVFNPLDKENLGRSIVNALVDSDVLSLSDLSEFKGVGVYCLSYEGKFPAYKKITDEGMPIYIGKAALSGTRKGADLTVSGADSNALYKRLGEHKKSIESAKNLRIDDFKYQVLVVDDIWVSLGEGLLISRFAPIWNYIVDGFGNHDPGSGRHQGRKSKWDVLHPGRAWAEKLQPREETPQMIAREVKDYLKKFRSSPPKA